MAYGSVVTGPRESDPHRRSQVLRVVLIGLAVTAASCLVTMHFAHSSVSLASADDVKEMEINAYLSSSEAAQFKKLLKEQAIISAKIPALLAKEAKMKPEDTKVRDVQCYCIFVILPPS